MTAVYTSAGLDQAGQITSVTSIDVERIRGRRKAPVTLMDLLAVANTAVSTTYDPMTPLVMAAAIYWGIVQVIRFGFGHLETYINRHQQAVA